MHQGRLPTRQVPYNALWERKEQRSEGELDRHWTAGQADPLGWRRPSTEDGKGKRNREETGAGRGQAWRRRGLEAGVVGGSHAGPPIQPAPPAQGCLCLPRASLTTLSSGTERLRVHSWLFTKESAGEKATHQGWDGTRPFAIHHRLAASATRPPCEARARKHPHALVPCAHSSSSRGIFPTQGLNPCLLHLLH